MRPELPPIAATVDADGRVSIDLQQPAVVRARGRLAARAQEGFFQPAVCDDIKILLHALTVSEERAVHFAEDNKFLREEKAQVWRHINDNTVIERVPAGWWIALGIAIMAVAAILIIKLTGRVPAVQP